MGRIQFKRPPKKKGKSKARRHDATTPSMSERHGFRKLNLSGLGLGHVKQPVRGKTARRQDRLSLMPRWQPSAANVHEPRQIAGQNRKGYFGGYFLERFGEEVCRSDARFHSAKRMLNMTVCTTAVHWLVHEVRNQRTGFAFLGKYRNRAFVFGAWQPKLLGFPPLPNGHPAFMTVLWVRACRIGWTSCAACRLPAVR